MEVHHHTHHPKKWKEYFWEFFMLFLAVFCGFLAEIQVEHYVEHQREKQYIISLVEDLKNDTADLKQDIIEWEEVLRSIDTLRSQIEMPVASRNTIRMYKSMCRINYNNTFLYHDRTVSQLKNAGNFRIIRKKGLAKAIIDYDAVVLTAIKDIENAFTNTTSNFVNVPQVKIFNSKYFHLSEFSGALDSAIAKHPNDILIKKDTEDILFELYNGLAFYKANTAIRVRYLKKTNERAIAIINDIKKEYKIE
jgi:hypothetical protein